MRIAESYPAQRHRKRRGRSVGVAVVLVNLVLMAACSAKPANDAPPTVPPAGPAASEPVTTPPAGEVQKLEIKASAAVFDAATTTLVVLGGRDLAFLAGSGGQPRTTALPVPATALTGDGAGVVYLSCSGGYLRADVRTGGSTRIAVAGHEQTDFTAIARRADGRLVLGSADGSVYTLNADNNTVAAQIKLFARVDSLATQGNTTVVLDRGQTSVTTIDATGSQAQQALRAGEGATTLAADPMGRVLVADTRGDELLVFGVDPLILRQRYPVRNAPYGLVGTRNLAWVSLTATNTVVGYDLATGIPQEKVRYPTVRQPDVLAFDHATNALYVVSASGDGVQVIKNAGQPQ
jgi:DNA-binding beta-propeller fold protein YncE